MWLWILIVILLLASAVFMAFERSGLPTTLSVSFKGDIKRETRLLAQYGQTVWTILTVILIWQLDRRRAIKIDTALSAAVIVTTTFALVLKRLLGRARPRCEHAGSFLGPSWRHANARESFPSSHSTSAMAYSVVLSAAYPGATATFMTMGIVCAILRYLMDAHWPSDVLAGIALGCAGGAIAVRVFL